MKGSQGSCFLISSPPTNTVPVYLPSASAIPVLCLQFHVFVTAAPCFRLLSFHILVCSRLTDDDYYEDDEEDDPDALKDPIYQVDLQVPF